MKPQSEGSKIQALRRGLRLLPKGRVARIALIVVPIALLLVFGLLLEPALRALEWIVGLPLRTFGPLLATPLGRLLLLNLTLAVAIAIAWRTLRSRSSELRAWSLIRRVRGAHAALVAGKPRRARRLLRSVARARVGTLPDQYPSVIEYAKLQLARLALERRATDRAMHWLARVRDPDLPVELRRSLVALRSRTLVEHGGVDPSAMVREVRELVASEGGDLCSFVCLRELARHRGDRADVVAQQRRIVRHTPAARRRAAERDLLSELIGAGEHALSAGDLVTARGMLDQARAVAQGSVRPDLLLGRVEAAAGDMQAAIRACATTRTVDGHRAIATWLEASTPPIPPRTLLEWCPQRATVLWIARAHARQGDLRRGLRAIAVAEGLFGSAPSTWPWLAVLRADCGDVEGATRMRLAWLRRAATPDESPLWGVSDEPSGIVASTLATDRTDR